MAPHRIGIIGVGKIARERHLPSIIANPAFDLVAASNVAGPPLDSITKVYESYQAMLAQAADLQVVAICTPPLVRHAIARAALHAGKHVLLEKPPAATPSEVEDLALLARQCGRVLFTAYHSHFNAAVDEAKRLLSDQTIAGLTVNWQEDVNKFHPGQDWIWQRGGFGVFDAGINALSIVTKILPQPLLVRDADMRFAPGAETPIAANLLLRAGDIGSDWHADFDWRPITEEVREVTVTTRDGMRLRLSSSGGRLEIDGRTVLTHERTEYAAMYRHFDTLLRTNTSEVDVRPLQLVADAFLMGRRIEL